VAGVLLDGFSIGHMIGVDPRLREDEYVINYVIKSKPFVGLD